MNSILREVSDIKNLFLTKVYASVRRTADRTSCDWLVATTMEGYQVYGRQWQPVCLSAQFEMLGNADSHIQLKAGDK